MLRKSLIIVSNLLLILLVIFILRWLLSPVTKKQKTVLEQHIQEYLKHNEIESRVIKEISQMWSELGERYFGPNYCPEVDLIQKQISPSYFNCHPWLWNCIWENGFLHEIDFGGQKFKIRALLLTNEKYSIGWSRSVIKPVEREKFRAGEVVKILISPGDRELRLSLPRTCQKIFLPSGVFPFYDQEGFWNNKDQKIFIDRYPVSVYDYNSFNNREMAQKVTDLFAPQKNLSLKKMKDYCTYQGGELLNSHWFNAASQPSAELISKKPPETPWNRERKNTFLNSSKFQMKWCSKFSMKPCSSINFLNDSSTWMGMTHSMGFVPEVFINRVNPESNIKGSNFLEEWGSSIHRIGSRKNINDYKKNQIGFRCGYQEVF